MIPVRQYAGVVGAVLVLLGVVGLVSGEGFLFNLLNIDFTEDIVHLVTGILMLYVGFAQTDTSLARAVVGGLGIVYLLVGIVGILSPTLFGLVPNGYTWADHVVHLTMGVLGLAVAWLLPDRARQTL